MPVLPKSTSGRTVLIDFNDSFTFNVVELLRRCGESDCSIVPVADLDRPGALDAAAEGAARAILSPGPGVPDDYPAAYRLLDLMAVKEVPVLGICLGHQIICSRYGCELENMESVVHGQPRRVEVIEGDPLFFNMPAGFTVGLYHSWVVRRPLSDNFSLLAEAADGRVMAVRHRRLPFRGIQFHPESFITEYGPRLLSNFLSL